MTIVLGCNAVSNGLQAVVFGVGRRRHHRQRPVDTSNRQRKEAAITQQIDEQSHRILVRDIVDIRGRPQSIRAEIDSSVTKTKKATYNYLKNRWRGRAPVRFIARWAARGVAGPGAEVEC